MTVAELRDILKGYDDEVEVQLMVQESVPVVDAIQGVSDTEEIANESENGFHPDADDEGGKLKEEETDNELFVFIVQGAAVGPGSPVPWTVC